MLSLALEDEAVPVDLHIGNLDDQTAEALRWRAAEHGCSIETELRSILQKALIDCKRGQAIRMMDEVRARTAGRNHTPAEVLVHKTRYER